MKKIIYASCFSMLFALTGIILSDTSSFGLFMAPSFAANAKQSAAIQPVNFETKGTEIMEVLNLTDKQKEKAQKLYNTSTEEISAVNIQLKEERDKIKTIKTSKTFDKAQITELVKLNTEVDMLYKKRDKIHNSALRKFENMLNKDQRQVWFDILNKGARMFPDVDTISSAAADTEPEAK